MFVSKTAIKNMDHCSDERNVMDQSYPIYPCSTYPVSLYAVAGSTAKMEYLKKRNRYNASNNSNDSWKRQTTSNRIDPKRSFS